MQNKNPIWHSLGHAVLVVLYVAAVGQIMFHGGQIFGNRDTWLTPIAVLLLFIVSATITGGLVLARPALLYFNGQKEEGLKFLGYTIMWLFILTILVFTGLFLQGHMAM
jgi:hypothetical protein